MQYLKNDITLLESLINKQFELIGEKITIRQIENGVRVKDGKKEKIVEWWKVYKFPSEEKYIEWKDWAKKKLEKYVQGTELEAELNFLDLVYGMTYPIEEMKEGQLEMF